MPQDIMTSGSGGGAIRVPGRTPTLARLMTGTANQYVLASVGKLEVERSVPSLHIPDEADQRSGVMSITIPG
jgi:hypothetical protein